LSLINDFPREYDEAIESEDEKKTNKHDGPILKTEYIIPNYQFVNGHIEDNV
jgi:hypothetical protein